MDLARLARPDIFALTAYSSARNEAATGEIWLNANENPWPPEPEYLQLNRYPEPQPQQLISLFAKLYQIPSDHLLVTRGSDEGIDLLFRAFCRAGIDNIIHTPPTYAMYMMSAAIQGVEVRDANLHINAEISFDRSIITSQTDTNTKLIFICNPNNPTGTLFPQQDILALSEQFANQALIIVDEAYIEFSSVPSMSTHLQNHSNLVVLRTLSKAYGLAGARCGALLAHPDIIALLKRVIAPYPIAKPVIERVLQAMTHEWIIERQQQIKVICSEREKIIAALKQSPQVLQLWSSSANFILCRVKNPDRFMRHFYAHGIVIRDRSKNLENCIRFTVGTPQENTRLITTLSAHPTQ